MIKKKGWAVQFKKFCQLLNLGTTAFKSPSLKKKYLFGNHEAKSNKSEGLIFRLREGCWVIDKLRSFNIRTGSIK